MPLPSSTPPSTVPPIAASAPPSTVPMSFPNSADSPPRSRNTDPSEEQPPGISAAPGGGVKLRLMCSYGGQIVPRSHDKSLCYVGGDTRIVLVDRHSSFDDLTSRLSKTLFGGRGFALKYQLPNEDLDSLVSVTTEEDLENMIDEYDRTSSSSQKPSRLRLFLFPFDPDSNPSIGSLLDCSTKSEDWLTNALNSSVALPRSLPESQSVNCLLGLEDDAAADAGVAAADMESFGDGDARAKAGKGGQDAPSAPDSVTLETSSSFGSSSSSPPLGKLRPIRVRAFEDGGVDGGPRSEDRRAGIEEQFTQMRVAAAAQKQDEGFATSSPLPPIPSSLLPESSAPSSGEYPGRVLASDDERSELPQKQPALQIRTDGGLDSAPRESVHRPPLLQQVQDHAGYGWTQPFDPHQQQPQSQFFHPESQYVHHQAPGHVQVPSFYPVYQFQLQQDHHYALANQDQQPCPVFLVPAGPAQAYSSSMNSPCETSRSATPNPASVNSESILTQQQQQRYAGLPHHLPQSVDPSSAAAARYGYEYMDAARAAYVYYPQGGLPPQYRAVTTAPAPVSDDAASYPQADGMKQQLRAFQLQ